MNASYEITPNHHCLQLFPHSPCSRHTGLCAVIQMHQPCSCLRAFSLLFSQPDMETSHITSDICLAHQTILFELATLLSLLSFSSLSSPFSPFPFPSLPFFSFSEKKLSLYCLQRQQKVWFYSRGFLILRDTLLPAGISSTQSRSSGPLPADSAP